VHEAGAGVGMLKPAPDPPRCHVYLPGANDVLSLSFYILIMHVFIFLEQKVYLIFI